MSGGRRVVGVVLGVLAPLALSVSCRPATQVTVDIHTNVACHDATQWQGVAVYTGSPGIDVETKDPSLTSKSCDASGHVGSVVVVPQSSKDATIAVRIVAGLTRPPDQCAAAAYEGCIIARRTIAFIPHEGLALRIDLTSDCVGHACDVLHTCVNGQCADARQSSRVNGDAAASTGPMVRCGDDPTNLCPANDPDHACCLTVESGKITNATCKPTVECAPPSYPLLCDKASDCAGQIDDAGAPWMCCLPNEGELPHNTQCLPFYQCDDNTGYRSFLCNDGESCSGLGRTWQCQVAPDLIPGYLACNIDH